MSINTRWVGAIYRKELRDFRRNRSLAVGMAIIPVIFCVQPLVTVLALNSQASGPLFHEHALLYLLGIPALAPCFVAAVPKTQPQPKSRARQPFLIAGALVFRCAPVRAD